MSKHTRAVLLATFLSLVQHVVSQETHSVIWDFTPKSTINVTVGDTIEFTWPTSGYHDIFIHPSGDCSITDDAIPVYEPATSGGYVKYTFQPGQGSPEGTIMFFACEFGEGVHCLYNVHQEVIVYSRIDTPSPTTSPPTTPLPTPRPTTSAPTRQPTKSPSISPTKSPISVSLTGAPVPTTAAPVPLPTLEPTAKPTLSPTNPPTIKATTFSPSNQPSDASASPSQRPLITESPTVVVSSVPTATLTSQPSNSPVVRVTSKPHSSQPSSYPTSSSTSPSLVPSSLPSTAPSGLPTSGPSLSPTVATGAPSSTSTSTPSLSQSTLEMPSVSPLTDTLVPTTQVMTTTFTDLSMTLFGISSMTQADQEQWQLATSLYQTDYYSDSSTILDLETELSITSMESSSQQQNRKLQEVEDFVTIMYEQTITYRIGNGDTPLVTIVMDPFATESLRQDYVTNYLNIADNDNLVAVSDTSQVTIATAAPTSSPSFDSIMPVSGDALTDGGNTDNGNDGLSAGGIVGIVAGLAAVAAIAMFVRKSSTEKSQETSSPDGESNVARENNEFHGVYIAEDLTMDPPVTELMITSDESVEASL